MKNFNINQRLQLSDNVFAFIKKQEVILFNRMNFERLYRSFKTLSHLKKIAQEMEKRTPALCFSPSTLKKIRVEITLNCNCACDYCLVYKNSICELGNTMDITTAKKITDFYKENIKKGSLMLIGGEPLLNWSVAKFFIENIEDRIQIFTNGTIINQDMLKTFRGKKNIRLFVSLDGRKKENRSRTLKDGTETYNLVINNIRRLQKNQCELAITCLVCNKNVNHLLEITKFFVKKLKVKYLGLGIPHYTENAEIDLDIKKYMREMTRIFEFVIKEKVYLDQLAKRFSPLITKKFRFYSCKILGEQKTFYPSGKETLCTKLDSLKHFAPKNNFTYLYKLIPINNKFCKKCPAIGICGGGCFWDGMNYFNHGVDERECVLNNGLLNYFLWKIYSIEKRNLSPREEFSSLIIQ